MDDFEIVIDELRATEFSHEDRADKVIKNLNFF